VSDDAEPPSEPQPGDPIAEVFPAERVTARFVVAMSLARNDLRRALADLDAQRASNGPDVGYRARLIVGHFIEALISHDAYCRVSAEVQTLITKVPDDNGHLKTVRRTRRELGDVLTHGRNRTFHYPTPGGAHDSDGHLKDVLASMEDEPTELHVAGRSKAVTLKFADDVALNMALGKYVTAEADARDQAAAIETAARSFVLWADALVSVHFNAQGVGADSPVPEWRPDGRSA
jgi:hypothetical protein